MLGARWAAGHGMPTEPAPLEMKAQDLPTTFGEWKGADSCLGQGAVQGQSGPRRRSIANYRDGRGRNVSLHFAVFEKSQDGHLQAFPTRRKIVTQQAAGRLENPSPFPSIKAVRHGECGKAHACGTPGREGLRPVLVSD